VSKYFRLKLVANGKIVGLPEEIAEQEAMKVLKEHWNNPDTFLEKGERLSVNGYLYWKEE